jgi:hypothetical protein
MTYPDGIDALVNVNAGDTLAAGGHAARHNSVNTALDEIKVYLAGSFEAWTAYTPTLGGTGWALGNGTITGRFCKLGTVVHFYVNIIFGSSSTFGGSALTVSTPFSRRVGIATPQKAVATDVSVSQIYSLTVRQLSAGSVTLYTNAAPIAGVTTNVPFAWAVSDVIAIAGTFEAE